MTFASGRGRIERRHSEYEVRSVLALGAPARAPPGLMTLINRGALGLTVPGTRRIAGAADYDDLLELVGDRRFVLLGEASHGSHDFYRERARITQRLIAGEGLHGGGGRGGLARRLPCQPLRAGAIGRRRRRGRRWATSSASPPGCGGTPTSWTSSPGCACTTTAVASATAKARFYGLDLYSLRASMEAVVTYLERSTPRRPTRSGALQLLRPRWWRGRRVRARGNARICTVPCEDQVVAELVDLRRRSAGRSCLATAGPPRTSTSSPSRTPGWSTTPSATTGTMYQGRVSSWNLRDEHMAETLANLAAHLDRLVGRAKIVVWEHNSHVGDARATELGESGEFNVGQLVRTALARRLPARRVHYAPRHGDSGLGLGRSRPSASTCARPWGAATRSSFTGLKLETSSSVSDRAPPTHFEGPLLERAIGVIYRPRD